MQVKKCSQIAAQSCEKQYPLTWAQIIKKEGVYEPSESGLDRSRIVVFIHGHADTPPAVLYYSGERLEPAIQKCWEQYEFRLTSEQVCFETRPALR